MTPSFILPPIRLGETALPDQWRTVEPWPLTDRVVTGMPYAEFRYKVWRSLLHYYHPTAFTYDYFDASRLGEIAFQRDGDTYASVRDLKDLRLLILVVGVADAPNAYGVTLVSSVTGLRRMHDRPTWVYQAERTRGIPASTPTQSEGLVKSHPSRVF